MIPCLCFLRMALTYIVPVRYCMNRGSANGAPAGGAFLVDIPEDWEPRAKQQPTGLIAYGAARRRPAGLWLPVSAAGSGRHCCNSRTGQIKNPLHIVQRIFMTRTGIEPMLQP